MFTPDKFQTDAIYNITHGCNVIVTAPTGSGKTFIAEEAIRHYITKGVVVYTTPVKCLSNEKRQSLIRNIGAKVGLITGDSKIDVDADLIVMTTECYNKIIYNECIKNDKLEIVRNISKSDISLVIFDEAHYINDLDRGHVWESSLIMSDKSTMCLLLSATIYRPESIQRWMNRIRPHNICKLTTSTVRPVPLHHCVFHETTSKYHKHGEYTLYNDGVITEIMSSRNGTLKLEKLKLLFANYNKIEKLKNMPLINSTIKHLQTKKMLNAIFFVFSCNKCEYYSNMCQFNRKPDDEKERQVESYAATTRLEGLLHGKDNEKDIKGSSTYKNILASVAKGVAYHHSGMVPILKEAVEIMFGEGHIKILFATETFAVGVNYPARTVVFTNITKYTDNKFDLINPSSYHQMSGRAGRRGKDTLGYVVHLPSMYGGSFRYEYLSQVMRQPRDCINRDFTINNDFVLKSIVNEENPIEKMFDVCSKSYVYRDIDFDGPMTEDVANVRNRISNYIYNNLNYLAEIGCITNCSEHAFPKITNKGEALLALGERICSPLIIELIAENSFDKMPLDVVASLIISLADLELKEVNKDIEESPEIASERRRLLSNLEKNRGVCSKMKEQYLIAQRYKVYEYIFDFDISFMMILKKWIAGSDLNLFTMAHNNNVHDGALYKALVRAKSIFIECAEAASHMRKDNLAGIFMEISRGVNSLSLIQDTLYGSS